MFRYQLENGILLTLDTTEPDEFGILQFEGDPGLVAAVRAELLQGRGPFGLPLRERMAAGDLQYALERFRIASTRVEGSEVGYAVNLPAGAVT